MVQGEKRVKHFSAVFSYVFFLSFRRDSTVLEKVWTGHVAVPATLGIIMVVEQTTESIWLFSVPCISCDLERCSWTLVHNCGLSFLREFFRISYLFQYSYVSLFIGKSLPDLLSLVDTHNLLLTISDVLHFLVISRLFL